ncbi:hypothetical protein FGB62_131g017 [Gracilaria domingensis]|nr:hypothetical protein FGB62_131g017 [Gracilaria domingensis]
MWTFKGAGQYLLRDRIPQDLVKCVQANIPPNLSFIDIAWGQEYERAVLTDEHHGFSIETFSRFQKRSKYQSRKGYTSRQGHWIASNYASDLREDVLDTYYGSVRALYQVGTRVQSSTSMTEAIISLKFVCVEWQNGLKVNTKAETVSTKLKGSVQRGALSDRYKTFESISCVDRKIGYFDHNDVRFFLDDVQRQVFEDGNVIVQSRL